MKITTNSPETLRIQPELFASLLPVSMPAAPVKKPKEKPTQKPAKEPEQEPASVPRREPRRLPGPALPNNPKKKPDDGLKPSTPNCPFR